jgi:hypothetical protein
MYVGATIGDVVGTYCIAEEQQHSAADPLPDRLPFRPWLGASASPRTSGVLVQQPDQPFVRQMAIRRPAPARRAGARGVPGPQLPCFSADGTPIRASGLLVLLCSRTTASIATITGRYISHVGSAPARHMVRAQPGTQRPTALAAAGATGCGDVSADRGGYKFAVVLRLKAK